MRLAVTATALVVVASAVCCAAAGCDSGAYYVYVARIYDPQRDCLSDVEGLDIDEGTDPGLGCAPKCLLAADSDGAAVVYATTMCGPVPFGVDSSGTNPHCAAALAALQRSDICLADGGSTVPIDAAPAPAEGASD